MKTIKLASIISVFFFYFCSDPLSDNNGINKNDIIGKWALYMTIANVGIDPIWDESSGKWIGDDTTTYCDTCINTFYIFDDDNYSVYLSHSADASPKHSLFISKYSYVNNKIESTIDTFRISSIKNHVMHLIKNDGYYFLRKYDGNIPPFYWPEWQTDTKQVN